MPSLDSAISAWEERFIRAVRAWLHEAPPEAQARYLAWLQAVVRRLEEDGPPARDLMLVLSEALASRPPSEGIAAEEPSLVWTPEAEQRLGRIPFFVRSMARRSIERAAQEMRVREITPAVMDRIRAKLGL